MPKQIRVGIIGCGRIADVTHVPGYKSAKGVKIVSLMDIKKSQIAKLKELQGLDDVAEFTNLDKFLASGLDAVSICTPNSLHYGQTLAALKAGMHVMCEKPMAATLPETTRMIAAAKKAGKVLQINQSLHYLPLYQKIAELVAEGEIGTPMHVRCIRTGATTPDKGWSPGARWFVQKKFQGGLILDIGVHMADLMKWVVGEVDEVAAYVDTRTPRIDVPDNVCATMRFKNGATGVLELSWSTPCGASTFEVYGTKGTLRQGSSAARPLELSKAGANRVLYPKLRARVKNSHQCFADAIRGKGASPTPGELGRDAIALCDAIAKSGESGKFVKVAKF
ncbi:MAG: Gfo/Idh/MocA family oxidoreductase [Candidatus Hydrogenedentes bacterium]|nr:Gfo/Idh/MocA family oxidoreductase [Candidatus Hydrogenedentota bacterium]